MRFPSLERTTRQARLAALALVCLASGATAQQGGGNGDMPGHSAFRPGAKPLYADDWSTTDIGDIPETIKVAGGTMEIVEESGRRFLKISESASFDLVLSGMLPESYTIDFDMRVPSSTGYAVEVRPDLPNSRPGTAGLSRRAEHSVVYCGAIGSGVYGDGPNTTKRFDDRFAKALVPCEIVVSAKGVKVYFAGQLASNVPGANLGRTNRIRIHVPAGQGQEALVSAVRVATDIGADIAAGGGGVAPTPSEPQPVASPDPVDVPADTTSPPPASDEPRSEQLSKSVTVARPNASSSASLKELPDRAKRRAEARAAERLDSVTGKIERKINEGADKVLDAADTVSAKTLRATDRIVDCLTSDLACIRRAKRAGAGIAVKDSQGRRVSSADSARAIARASSGNP
jgi:hypothetical protein